MEGVLERTTAPAEFTLAEVFTKEQIRDLGDSEDDLLLEYLAAAREMVETDSRRALLPQTWRLFLDCYPECGVVKIPRCPVSAVSSFQVYNTSGAWQTLIEGTDYVVDLASEPARICRAYGAIWPTHKTSYPNCIKITFTAGYADVDAVPPVAMQAMRLLVGHWYRNRSPVAMLSATAEIELTYCALIKRLRY